MKNEFLIIVTLVVLSFTISSAQTRQSAPIIIENQHIVIELIGEKLIVTNATLLSIPESADKTTALRFSLPEGYQDFEIIHGLDESFIAKEKDRIVDTRNITEGKLPVAFKYKLIVRSNSYDFSLSIYEYTEVFYFLAKNLELQISSDNLVDEGIIDMGKGKYHAFSGVSFKKGETITVSIKGLGKGGRRKKVLIVSLIVLIILIITAVIIFGEGKSTKTDKSSSALLTEKKKALAFILAALDEKYKKGEIEKTVYRELHNENKKKLEKIIEKIEESTHENSDN